MKELMWNDLEVLQRKKFIGSFFLFYLISWHGKMIILWYSGLFNSQE